MYNYLIVGAGLFGSVFARQATDAGKKVLVIDKRPNIAGNVYTEDIENIHVHKYGAHIFHTNNKEVWNYVTRFAEFNRFTNSPVANYKGELYSLPFNMYTFNKMWGVVTPAEAKARIEQQKAAGHRGAFIRSIICTDQHIVLAGIRACPVIAARIRPIPAGGLFFVCPRRVLVCDGQADKVCREFLTAPEAGVEIVTADGDWAVRLALKWVMVDPKRLQRFGIERLNRTVGKPDKHHTLGICRGCDGKA